MSLGMPMSLKYEWLELVTLKYGLSSFHWRSKPKITSSAFMSRVGLNARWLCHLTPLRSVKVYVRPSAEMSHFSARPGTTLVPPRSNSTMRL
jgi:hypothetical protein